MARKCLFWCNAAPDGGFATLGEIWVADNENFAGLYWCRGLTLDRWRSECRLVEERFSLFRSFAEPPFLGFRGVVASSGCEYQVMAAAEMDLYPRYLPWAFVTGAREDGKLSINLSWDSEASRFADVIEAVVLYIEAAIQTPHSEALWDLPPILRSSLRCELWTARTVVSGNAVHPKGMPGSGGDFVAAQ